MAGYTAGDWSFDRDPDGSVRITDAAGDGVVVFQPETWVQIVAHVAVDGDVTAATVDAARILHRSAASGRFVSSADVDADPAGTVTEHRGRAGMPPA